MYMYKLSIIELYLSHHSIYLIFRLLNLYHRLYVANEVLQNSKRNRGTKFLEAFSPALSSSLEFMVKTDPSIVEKVRRIVY